MQHINAKGFTLAELLIALAILGVIATFTIPKIISAQTDSQKKAVAKEIISTISSAVSLSKTKGELSFDSTFEDLTPYMNYVAVDTTSNIDGIYAVSYKFSCASPNNKCLRFHNGAILLYSPDTVFGSDFDGDALNVLIDPDGRETPNQDSLGIMVYYSGRVSDYESGTGYAGYAPPAWFSW